MEKKIVRVAMLGAGFIGQMHSIALRSIEATKNDPPVKVELIAICDQNLDLAKKAAERFGYHRVYSKWEEMIEKEDFDLFINAAPNHLHGVASIAAAKKGAHVMIEKPLAKTADESYEIWKAIEKTGVIHASAFIWMAIPAIRTMREMIQSGELGEIMHFRSQFMMNMVEEDGSLSWRFDRNIAGSGVVGDNAAHHFQTARFLVGEFKRVSAITKTYAKDTAGRVTNVNEDAFVCCAELGDGIMGTFEANRVVPGHQLTGYVEVDGSKGSVYFYMERFNEVNIRIPGKGVLRMMATKSFSPSAELYLPAKGPQQAHPHGWNDMFTIEDSVVVNAVANGTPIRPAAADLEDAYHIEEIVDTVMRASESRKFENVVFRK